MALTKRLLLAAVAAFALSAPAMAADMIGNCEVSGAKGSIPIASPGTAGQFTVAVSLPAPVWWNGDTPESIKDGMEYCMAAEIAWRAGYDKLVVKNVGWDALIAAQTEGGWDLALSEVSITEDRKKVHDFSVPYFNSDMGVVIKADAPIDATKLKTAKLGVQQGTTGAAFVMDKINKDVRVFDDSSSMFTALRAGEIDAAVTDTSIVLAEEVSSGGKSKVIGQFKTGETYGALYLKGNANNPTIDKIIDSMKADGTMAKLGAKYLAAAWGKDPSSIPYLTP